ncbi:hypothetical protein [Bacillus bombysepticus]|uniref:hypothetical protein n=1 Tax=Bacillus bombysepticus TaxID=658666 RepID=UPI0030187067
MKKIQVETVEMKKVEGKDKIEFQLTWGEFPESKKAIIKVSNVVRVRNEITKVCNGEMKRAYFSSGTMTNLDIFMKDGSLYICEDSCVDYQIDKQNLDAILLELNRFVELLDVERKTSWKSRDTGSVIIIANSFYTMDGERKLEITASPDCAVCVDGVVCNSDGATDLGKSLFNEITLGAICKGMSDITR